MVSLATRPATRRSSLPVGVTTWPPCERLSTARRSAESQLGVPPQTRRGMTSIALCLPVQPLVAVRLRRCAPSCWFIQNRDATPRRVRNQLQAAPPSAITTRSIALTIVLALSVVCLPSARQEGETALLATVSHTERSCDNMMPHGFETAFRLIGDAMSLDELAYADKVPIVTIITHWSRTAWSSSCRLCCDPRRSTGSVTLIFPPAPQYGRTVLHHLAQYHHYEDDTNYRVAGLIRWLVEEKGMDIDIEDRVRRVHAQRIIRL